MFFRKRRATVFGRGETYTALAVFAAVLMAVVVLLAAPAWSKDAQNSGGSERAREATGESSARAKGKASGAERNGGPSTQRDSKGTNGKASGKGPGQATQPKAQNNSSQLKSAGSGKSQPPAGKGNIKHKGASSGVGDGDTLTIPGDYKEVSSDASITLEDADGTRVEFRNGKNAEIEVKNNGDLEIIVKRNPNIDSPGRDDELSEGFRIVNSKGVQRAGKESKRNKRHRKNKRRGLFRNGFLSFLQRQSGSPDDVVSNQQYNDQYNDQYGPGNDQYGTNNPTNNQYGGGGAKAITCPGSAIAIAGESTSVAGKGTCNNTNNQYAGTGQNQTTGQNQYAGQNQYTGQNQYSGQDQYGGLDQYGTVTGTGGARGTGTAASGRGTATGRGMSLAAGDQYSDIDNQEPVSRPQGDVIDEVDIGGRLPDTGGPQPLAVLVVSLGVALVVAGFAVWQFGARRE